MKKIEQKHILIPKHTKLSAKEKADLLKHYNIALSNLPSIVKDDSAVSHLTPKADDIIKIVRKSSTAGQSIFYRVVVDA